MHEWRRRALIAFFIATGAGGLLFVAPEAVLGLLAVVAAAWGCITAYLLHRGVLSPAFWVGWSASSQLLGGLGLLLWLALPVALHFVQMDPGVAAREVLPRLGQVLILASWLLGARARRRLEELRV
jgi:hypothetical protein